jgi:hypothetical protein
MSKRVSKKEEELGKLIALTKTIETQIKNYATLKPAPKPVRKKTVK